MVLGGAVHAVDAYVLRQWVMDIETDIIIW